jgi:PAS domain S-box-containing protein
MNEQGSFDFDGWNDPDPRQLAAMAVALLDAEGVVTGWSPGARRMLGYAPEEAVGQPAVAFLAAEVPARARRGIARREEWSASATLRHRDGRHVEAEVRASPTHRAQGALEWSVELAEPGPARGRATVLMRGALEQLPIGIGVYDDDGRLVGANGAALRLMDVELEDVLGMRPGEIQRNATFARLERLVESTLRSGEAVSEEAFNRVPGETRAHARTVFVYPLRGGGNRVYGAGVAAVDTTAQHRARQRLSIVNEAGLRLGSTLDVEQTAQELADVAVDRFADLVAIDLRDSLFRPEEPESARELGDVVFRCVAFRSVPAGDPQAVLQPGQTDRYPEGSPPARALATGVPSLHRSDDPEVVRWLACDPARAARLRDYGIHSLIIAPLLARGTTLGLALFARHRTPDPYDADDLLLAEEITARAAVCVDNAYRYTHQQNTALALQRSLLPQHTPPQVAVEVASRYLPAGSRRGVGGDWFDVIPLSGARVALVVGDVVGYGIQASAAMGRLRTAVRTLADIDIPPDELLTHLDDLVLRLDREEGDQLADQPLSEAGDVGATCLYAVYDPASGRCTMARAGHPLPAIVSPDGAVDFPDLPSGPPLGLGGLPFECKEVQLPEGSLLALYTDGLIRSRDYDLDAGTEKLRHALAQPPAALEEVCDGVLDALVPSGGTPVDDIALLVARTRVLDGFHVATWDLAPEAAVVARARRLATDQLATWGMEDSAFVTELVVSELVTNAIRYADPPFQLRLIHDTSLICEVSDTTGTAPHMRRARVLDEGGRGLLLVAQLTQRWGTRHTAWGKVIWAEQTYPAQP